MGENDGQFFCVTEGICISRIKRVLGSMMGLTDHAMNKNKKRLISAVHQLFWFMDCLQIYDDLLGGESSFLPCSSCGMMVEGGF